MKYDDDELAEAALFLAAAGSATEARAETDAVQGLPPIPASLEERLLLQGRAIAADVRFTTTKAAAMALEDDVEGDVDSRPARSRWTARASADRSRRWVGWLAAAACFAFAVYEWRSAAVDRRAATPPPAPPPSVVVAEGSTLKARTPQGDVVAVLSFAPGARAGEVVALALPPNLPGEHYRVWLSKTNDRAGAIPVGSFRCAEACRDRRFTTTESPELQLDGVRGIWLTHDPETAPWTLDGAGRIVGSSP
jgi:hypothetical protein